MLVECKHEHAKKTGCTKAGTQRFKCRDCGKRFTESTRTLEGMRLGVDKSSRIIAMLCEGLSIRAVSRLANVDKNTVLALLLIVGERCQRYMADMHVNLPVENIQIDEIWSFVGCKERARKRLSKPVGSCGDSYCFTALEGKSKLLVTYHMGERNGDEGWRFVRKLVRACVDGKFSIASDGWRPYKHLIPNHFPKADYGMVIKVFSSAQESNRYSPGQIIEVKRKPVAGNPDDAAMNTSHCERMNLSIRMGMRRFTRLTNGFSKSHLHHEAALALFFMHYNYVAKHGTLKTTPAVAAKLTDKPWTVAEMIERTANYSPPAPKMPTLADVLEALGLEDSENGTT
jgi:transposase-like protein/IS1 family transposase